MKVPKLRTLPFETAIIERYRGRQSSVEEALVEMYLAGVSVRGVEDITEALWGTHVSRERVILRASGGSRARPRELLQRCIIRLPERIEGTLFDVSKN